jgi:dihydroorotase
MTRVTRRRFLNQVGAAALAAAPARAVASSLGAAAPEPAAAQTGAQAQPVMYDLLIRGGRVIDPSQNLSAVRDVAIAGSRIARVAADIPASSARQVFDATGKMVTPGLIDMHTHVYKYGITLNVDSDIVGVGSGVTTVLDCGSTGAGTFQGFRKYVIDSAATRIYALLNISTIGLVVTNEIYLDPKMIDARAAIRTINANRDRILGVKVRVNGRHGDLLHDIEVLKVAREVADATGLPIMMHWSVEPDLLALLKAGDILAHPFNPPSATSANLFGADGAQADTVLPQILALKDRGIWTDGQLGTTHHSWAVSEKAVKQGWFPDAISTDIGRAPDGGPASVLVPMSEFLHMGMPLEQIIAGVTSMPARIMKFPERVGTLAEGTTADVAVLDLASGTFPFADSTRTPRTLDRQFVAVATVKGGVFLKGAPQAPAAPAGTPVLTGARG